MQTEEADPAHDTGVKPDGGKNVFSLTSSLSCLVRSKDSGQESGSGGQSCGVAGAWRLYLARILRGVVGGREPCLRSLFLESREGGWESEFLDSLLSLPHHISPIILSLF